MYGNELGEVRLSLCAFNLLLEREAVCAYGFSRPTNYLQHCEEPMQTEITC